MKTTPTCLVPSRSSGHGNAAVLPTAFGTMPPRRRGYGSLSFALLTLLALLGLAGRVAAQGLVPERLSYQGFMADANGVPLGSNAPVNLPVVFRIFSAPTGGTTNWSERQVVTFDKGYYSVLLGQGAAVPNEPSPLLSAVVLNAVGNELYVESTVTINGSDAKILPRMRMLPTPYAFLASRALSVDGAGIISGTIADARLSANIRSGPIADSRLSANITSGPIADSRLSANITSGPIADSRLSANITSGPIVDSRLSDNIRSGPIADSRLSANIPRRNSANTFTTNQTIVGSLTVTGNMNLGNAGQLKAAGGDESLRIVRGLVKLTDDGNFTPFAFGAAGTTNAFSVVRNANGNYRITFQPAFNGEPSVTVCPIFSTSFGPNPDDAFAQIRGLTSSYVDINFLKANVGGGIRLPFSFIAVGPR